MRAPNETIKDRLLELRTGLQNKDLSYCGDAPRWKVEYVLETLEKTVLDWDSVDVAEQARSFALASTYTVADLGTSGCEVLLNRLHEFFVLTE